MFVDCDDTLGSAVPKLLAKCPNVVAINIMHTPMDEITPSLKELRKHWDGPIGCYPNNSLVRGQLQMFS